MTILKTESQCTRENTKNPTTAGVWSIVLAGGNGQRMQSFVRNWLEDDRPKQYCNFTGQHTMLEHTLDRARALSEEQVVTVIARGHERYIENYNMPGSVVCQPRACGTAPGVFLPLSIIMSQDRNAVVHILPSDHFIYSKYLFVKHMCNAEKITRVKPGKLVLSAATADYAEKEYGWIEPEVKGKMGIHIRSFREKPNASDAEKYMQHGYMWNTMIMTVKARTLWQIGWDLYPKMMELYESLSIDRSDSQKIIMDRKQLEAIYSKIPNIDFSKDIVEKIPEATLLLPLKDIMWSDWGRPERVLHCLQAIGTRPAFPVGLVPVSEYTPEPAYSVSY